MVKEMTIKQEIQKIQQDSKIIRFVGDNLTSNIEMGGQAMCLVKDDITNQDSYSIYEDSLYKMDKDQLDNVFMNKYSCTSQGECDTYNTERKIEMLLDTYAVELYEESLQ